MSLILIYLDLSLYTNIQNIKRWLEFKSFSTENVLFLCAAMHTWREHVYSQRVHWRALLFYRV